MPSQTSLLQNDLPDANLPFAVRLLDWFALHGRRHLPWQQDPSPYRVWVSEIMLQQTQVKTVIPYYEKFMATFPDVATLAQAEQDEVLHLWTGLGYYARARNLHRCAGIIHEDYAGIFPDDVDRLSQLPGIGRSTAGAILSLSRNHHAVILDGNVKRVLCRHDAIEGWPGQAAVQRQLWDLAASYTPQERCSDYTQAIMDLGATVCTRSRPACLSCPLQASCQAYATGRQSDFPQRKPRKALPLRSTYLLIFHATETNRVLLEKRPPQGIWGGLWSFPETEDISHLEDLLFRQIMEQSSSPRHWQPLRHTFTHFHLDITPVVISLGQEQVSIMENNHWHWYDLDDPPRLGLAAPVKKLLAMLDK